MEAGRELDALVADKVMGLNKEEIDRLLHRPRPGRIGIVFEELPHYSTNMAAAWEVVQKMIAEFPAPDYQFGVSWVSAEDGWSAGLGHFVQGEHYSDEWFTEFGSSAPHAICLAALRAKGVEIE